MEPPASIICSASTVIDVISVSYPEGITDLYIA